MPTRNPNTFTTIRTEGALLPPDLLQRIADGDKGLEGLTPADYHRPSEKINEAINRSWNALQGAWANFKAAQEKLLTGDLGTSITRERWLLPLFRELDYGRLPIAQAHQIDGKSYAISHSWGQEDQQVPIHLVSYQLDLDHRTPGIAGASASSPHSLVQVFLNRSDTHFWGFVSNGYRLRILRDNVSLTRQSYVEFDLYSMMEGEVYADFVLLWLVCHQSRVENGRDCWLEKWMKTAEQQGTRALDTLRDGVQQAIEALGVGFLEHPRNTVLRDRLQNGTLNAQDYYRQLLRLVYRLLFLFVAEDRGLLYDPAAPQEARDLYTEHYSTQRLRRIAERLKGTRHTDLFEGLRLVMKLLSSDENGASASLGLAVLGSFLFSDDAVTDVIGCQIDNIHLLDAVRVLAFMVDNAIHMLRPVDYKNLDSDELGSVYESLLELHPQINVPAKTFALATAGGNERKTTGSYYTPTSLINALLDSALNPVIAEATKKPQPEAALLDLKICDPACGSGHFLIAAAHRVAKALASVRTGEEEPAPDATRHALRDVIGNCIYGVDINPMAVELCKIALWLDALEPGKPLSFLDHRIQVGNSLIGTTARLMAEGIPDGAFQPIEGDDKKFSANLRKQNDKERKQNYLFDVSGLDLSIESERLAADVESLDAISDDSIAGVRQKEARFRDLAASEEYRRTRLLADAWCAAFVWEKTPSAPMPITNFLFRQLKSDPDSAPRGTLENIARLAVQYQFFHWHIAFPDVFRVPDEGEPENAQLGWNGGFDCVLGNPPWERIKLQEKEWFAQRNPEIAIAPSAAIRKHLIRKLLEQDSYLLQAFRLDQRQAEGESHFMRISNRYSLTGTGDVNTYALFAELSLGAMSNSGYVGLIIPTGIATDNTYQVFFDYVVSNRHLVSLYDFENRGHLFADLHTKTKFCLFTLSGTQARVSTFCFLATQIEDLRVSDKVFELTPDDFTLFNPNTHTCPLFRERSDVELTRRIYRNVAVLINEASKVNSWQVSFLGMFHMTNDSNLFLDESDIDSIRLYEAKMMWHFDTRWATYDGADTRLMDSEERMNPTLLSVPRYWVKRTEVDNRIAHRWYRNWLVGFRVITDSRNERSMVASILPRVATGNSLAVIFPGIDSAGLIACFVASLNSYVCDYVVRQKIAGTNLNLFIVEQLPVLSPDHYSMDVLRCIVPRILELTYTAWDLQPFAQDIGYDGSPFIWDEDRRFVMRCELDALYFHLYDIVRDDVDYIMETFPIVKRKDEAAHGEYRTKRVILELYDEMSNGVESYVTRLDPPPADPRVAHPAKEG